LNAGLGAQLLQRGGGRLLLSPQAKADLEVAKEMQRRGVTAASLKADAEAKVVLVEEAAALKLAQEKGQQQASRASAEAVGAPAQTQAASNATPSTPAATPAAAAAVAEAALVSPLESPDAGAKAADPNDPANAEVSERTAKPAIGADANIIDGTTVNSFLERLATVQSSAGDGDDSSEDGFAEKVVKVAAPNSAALAASPASADAQTLVSAVADAATAPAVSPAPAPVLLPSCPYIPALVKYVGYADDMERCVLAVSKGVLFLRLQVGEQADVGGNQVDNHDHDFSHMYDTANAQHEKEKRNQPLTSKGHLAKLAFLDPLYDCRVLPDPNEADQFYFWHKWHGLICIRVALEHKLRVLDCFPQSLFRAANTPQEKTEHRKVLEASEIQADVSDMQRRPSQQTQNNTVKYSKKDYINANKNVTADNLHFKHTTSRPEAQNTSDTSQWSIAQPQKQIIKKADMNLLADTSAAPGLSLRPQLDSTVLRGMSGGNGGAVRRRSVEYLLQGVGANHIDIEDHFDSSAGIYETFSAPAAEGESEAAAQNRSLQKEMDVCNNSKGIAAGIMSQYSSRGKDYGSKSIPRRRVALLCSWVNGLQLQPVQIEPETLHENLCSGLLLTDLLRLLLPGSSGLFSHLHIPALSRHTCLRNLEQCMGIILRSKTFVFSERIPQPHEILDACGSGGVGHTNTDAQIAVKRALNRLATFLDEIFRAYVMSDFIFFNVDVPTMISRGATTISTANHMHFSKGPRGSDNVNMLALDGADRYKSGGSWNSSVVVKDSVSIAAHSKSEKGSESLTEKIDRIRKAKEDAIKLSKVEKTKERERQKAEREKKALEKKAAAARRGSTWGKERRLSSISPAAVADAITRASRRSSTAASGVDLAAVQAVAVPVSIDAVLSTLSPPSTSAEVSTANVPSPTPRLLNTLRWFQDILKLYHRGFSPNLANYLTKCQEVSHDREALKKLQSTQIMTRAAGLSGGPEVATGLPAALESVWASMQSGVALFCVILHFYGYGTVITPPTAAAPAVAATPLTSFSSEGGLRSSSDSPTSTARRMASAAAEIAAAKMRVDPIFMYGAPRTRAEHRSNIVYLFRLLNAIGIDCILTVDDWINSTDPDFLILMMHDIYVSVGEEGKTRSVVPVKDMNYRKRFTKKQMPSTKNTNLVPFGSAASESADASFESSDSEDDELSSLRVFLVVPHGKTETDAYIQGLSFADDLGLGAGGDHESEPHYLWILEGFGGPFSEAEQHKYGGKSAPRASVLASTPADIDDRTETSILRRGNNGIKATATDIEAATHALFMEALKRNQKALGGVSNILRKGYGVGGTIPGSGFDTTTGTPSEHTKLADASSYTRIKKDKSKLVEVRRRESTTASAEFAARLSNNTLGTGFAHLLALFARIKEAEAEAACRAEVAGDMSWQDMPVHHPHHQPSAVDEDGHHHHHRYTTGELLMRALVVSKHPAAPLSDDDYTSDDSSVEYSVDTEGEIRVDDYGNLKEHVDPERDADKAQRRAERQDIREEKAAIKASKGPTFDFSQLLHLQLGISAVDGEVKCYRRVNSESPLSLYYAPEEREEEEPVCYSVDEVLAMHADNPHHAGVVKALRSLAAHYNEHSRDLERYARKELEIEAAYLKLETGAMNHEISKEEFSDILGYVEEQEKSHNEGRLKAQSRYTTLLESLSLAYAEALRMAEEYLPPLPADESKETDNAVGAAIPPPFAGSPQVGPRGNRATQILQRKLQEAKQSSPNRLHRDQEEKEKAFNLTCGKLNKGLFSKPQPLMCAPLPDKDGRTAWDFKPLTAKHFTDKYLEQRAVVPTEEVAPKGEKITIFSNPDANMLHDNDDVESSEVNTSQDAVHPSSRIVVRSPSKTKAAMSEQRRRAKDNTVREVFASKDGNNDLARCSSPFKILSVEEKQSGEAGWNRNHFHVKKTHNVHQKAQESISTTTRTLVNTPHKYRGREEGADNSATEDVESTAFVSRKEISFDSHESDKASFTWSRIGRRELMPARIINTTYDAESIAYATRSLHEAGDASNVKAFRRFLKGLKARRTDWFGAQGIIFPSAPTPSAPASAAAKLEASGAKEREKSIESTTASAAGASVKSQASPTGTPQSDPHAYQFCVATAGNAEKTLSTQRELIAPPDEMDLAQPMSLPSPRDGGNNDDNISPPVALPNRPKPKVRGSVMIKSTSLIPDKKYTAQAVAAQLQPKSSKSIGDKDGLTTRSGKVYLPGTPEESTRLPWSPEPFSPVPLGELPDADYDPADDSDASSATSGKSKDSDDSNNDEWKEYAIEEIPSASDAAVEAALKWLSVPRPIHQLDSNGNARACSLVLANDVNGMRIVGSGATAAGYRAKQLDDEEPKSTAGVEFTYSAAQRAAKVVEADIRPVFQIRDGEGVVPMQNAPTAKMFLQDIEYITRYDGPLPGNTTLPPTASFKRSGVDSSGASSAGIEGLLTDRTKSTARATSPPRLTAAMKVNSLGTAGVTEIQWAVSLQLKTGMRSMLAGRGRSLVSFEFDQKSDTDAANFRLHVQTLLNCLPSVVVEQQASQERAAQHRAVLTKEREVRAQARLARKAQEKAEKAMQRELRHAEQRKERARKLAEVERQKLTLTALKAARRAQAQALLDQKAAAKRATTGAGAGSGSAKNKGVAPMKAAFPASDRSGADSGLQTQPLPPASLPGDTDTHEEFLPPPAAPAAQEGVTVFNPPREFKCIFEHGGVLKSLPLTREFSTSEHHVGLIDMHDILLVKAIHTNVSITAALSDSVQRGGGAFYEIVSNPKPIIPGSDFLPADGSSSAAAGGWLPVMHNNEPLLAMVNPEPAALPTSALTGRAASGPTSGPAAVFAAPATGILMIKETPITPERPLLAQPNGDVHDSHPSHIADVKQAITSLVSVYDAPNAAIAGKVDALLHDWEGKELALLHILHAAYSKKKGSAGDKEEKEEEDEGEEEADDDAAVERKMRIAAQHAHAST